VTKLYGPKRWRVFYNSHNLNSLPWCIDSGNQVDEMYFEKVLVTVPACTAQLAEKRKYPEVSAWLECEGILEVNGKLALIRGVEKG
jgi:hypothetical protein